MPAKPPPVPPPRPSEPIAGRYELLDIGGRGGMAVVWRAHQHGPGRFGRTVAVKQMHPHLAKLRLYREMFCEEARVAAAVSDPNIPQIYDFVEEDDGELYLVMEWVDGVDLATLVRYVNGRLGLPARWDLVAAVGVGVLRGLAAAHERAMPDGSHKPIIHRDVSPQNVLVSTKGAAKLIDFGLSFAHDRDTEDTEPGVAKGKLAYLAPEIVRGGRPSPLTDQFAMGTTLWESLTGRRAFEDPSPLETYRRVANAEIERLDALRPDVPPELVATVHRALSLDPAARFPSAREMARHLGEALKRSHTAEDLYDVLARTVREARAGLGIGARTQDPALESPLQEDLSGLVELLEEDKATPKKGAGIASWVPSLISRLRGRPPD